MDSSIVVDNAIDLLVNSGGLVELKHVPLRIAINEQQEEDYAIDMRIGQRTQTAFNEMRNM